MLNNFAHGTHHVCMTSLLFEFFDIILFLCTQRTIFISNIKYPISNSFKFKEFCLMLG